MLGTVWVSKKTGEASCLTLEQDNRELCIQIHDKYTEFYWYLELISSSMYLDDYPHIVRKPFVHQSFVSF